jgi:hypothetical protein
MATENTESTEGAPAIEAVGSIECARSARFNPAQTSGSLSPSRALSVFSVAKKVGASPDAKGRFA